MPPNAAAPRMGAPEWIALLALSSLWGGSFFFYKVLVTELPPFTVVLGRVSIAALALHLLLLARRDPLVLTLQQWKSFLVLGLLNNVIPFSLIAFGEIRIASGSAAILNATTPIFTILVAHFFTSDEKITAAKAAMDTWMRSFRPYDPDAKHDAVIAGLNVQKDELVAMEKQFAEARQAATEAITAHEAAASELIAKTAKKKH